MNIKKVDDKPMVIHTKEKTKIHVKAQPETKIKGRNVLVVEKKPKIAGAGNEEQTDKRKSALKVRPDQIKKDDHKQQGKGSAKEEVRKSVQKEAGVYTDVIRDVHAGGNCIVCAEPVFLNGKLAAVVGVGSYLDTINEAVLNTSIGETGYAFLIGEEGQIIISPKEEGETSVSEQSAGDLRNSSNRNLAAIAVKVLSGEEGQEKITLDGKEVYVSYVPLADLHWGLITVLDVEEVLTPARDSQAGILTLADGVSKEQSQMIRQMLITLLLVMGVVFAVICLVGTVYRRYSLCRLRYEAEKRNSHCCIGT